MKVDITIVNMILRQAVLCTFTYLLEFKRQYILKIIKEPRVYNYCFIFIISYWEYTELQLHN